MGPADLSLPMGTSFVQGAIWTDVSMGLGFPLSPFLGDPPGPIPWRF